MNEMLVQKLEVGPLQVNCYLIGCPDTRQAMVVDPGGDGERILEALRSHHLELRAVVNTHGHFDHTGANRFLVEKTGAALMIHESDVPLLKVGHQHAAAYGLTAEPSPAPDRLLRDEDSLTIGNLKFTVLHLPGHSPGGIALSTEGRVFAGDILFAGSIGRTDLPGGDHRALIDGIRRKLMILPDDTVVHPGHGPETTIGREKRINPYVGGG